jgi:hypothetical protein
LESLKFFGKKQFHAEVQRRRGMHENDIGTIVVEECINIHRELGPGVWEVVYEVILVDARTLRC